MGPTEAGGRSPRLAPELHQLEVSVRPWNSHLVCPKLRTASVWSPVSPLRLEKGGAWEGAGTGLRAPAVLRLTRAPSSAPSWDRVAGTSSENGPGARARCQQPEQDPGRSLWCSQGFLRPAQPACRPCPERRPHLHSCLCLWSIFYFSASLWRPVHLLYA